MTEALKKLRDVDPFVGNRITSDSRFWVPFQQDYYTTIIMNKSKITHVAQYVDWEYMAKKNDPIFNEIISTCRHQRVKYLMGFRHDWNKEIIAQFYATVHFGDKNGERAMVWMTNGKRLGVTFSHFLELFNIIPEDKDLPKLHDEGLLEPHAMSFMYLRSEQPNVGHVKGLYTYYSVLNRLLRVSITPRDGNPSDVSKYMKNLMIALRPGAPPFSVGDFIWQEIKNLSEDPKKICSYSPYIMFMIEKASKMDFPKNVKHKPLRPNPIKDPRVQSPEQDQEIREEEGTQQQQF